MAMTVADLAASKVMTNLALGVKLSGCDRSNSYVSATTRRKHAGATVAAIATPRPPIKRVVDIDQVPSTLKPNCNWATSLCDHLEAKLMSWAAADCDSDDDSGLDSYLLAENYAPVEEMAPTASLPVTGSIPSCLNGQFLRNGPNPKFQPLAGYHWFDGDGMIHGLKIKDGKATYAARYVQTSRLLQEERYGAAKFMKIGDLNGLPGFFIAALQLLRIVLGVLDFSNGDGTGNTSLVFHNDKLLALHERDRPYNIKVLEDGDLQTINIEDYGQKLHHPVTSHPKIDPITGEMFIFMYQPCFIPLFSHNCLIYRVISKDGVLGDPVKITTPCPIMMHDFAISENYAIFMDLPLCASPMYLLKGGFIFNFDSSKECRLGIFPRYAIDASQIQWFKIPPCFISHIVNAWEEGDEVVLICCRKENFNLCPDLKFKTEKAWFVGTRLYEFRMNLESGEVKHKQLSNQWAEFPRINPEYTGRKVRYAYCALFDEYDKIKGIAKYDLSMEPSLSSMSKELKAGGNVAGVFHYGSGRAGEEAIFVPRKSGMDHGLEDDGYLVSFVHDANTKKSEVVVIDAKTMEPKPVAVVKLPRRVPHGFHAHFVSQEQLRQQA